MRRQGVSVAATAVVPIRLSKGIFLKRVHPSCSFDFYPPNAIINATDYNKSLKLQNAMAYLMDDVPPPSRSRSFQEEKDELPLSCVSLSKTRASQ